MFMELCLYYVHVYMKLSELHCDSKSQEPEFTDFENVCNGHISQNTSCVND